MANAARGAEEEVFETPDFAEDDVLSTGAQAGGSSQGRTDAPVKTITNKVPDAEVVSAYIPPRAAFEVFMGRTYAGARENMSDIIGASSTGFEGAVYAGEGYHREHCAEGSLAAEATEAGNVGGARRTGESPVQRLVRLREETTMLAEDLEEMSKARRKGDAVEGGEAREPSVPGRELEGGEEAGGGIDSGGYALWSAMAKETDDLKRQLALLSGDPKFKHIVSSTRRTGLDQEALQERLSDGVLKELESLREAGGGATVAGESGKKAAAAGGTAAAAGGDGAGSVTYELFLQEALEARRRDVSGTGGGIPGVEARIAALEKALGAGKKAGGETGAAFGGQAEGPPLAVTVASLEQRVAILEPGRLDSLRQKAQLARAELDALAKSRGAASASSPSGGGAARQKKLEEAFKTLQTWQGVSAGLPALVDRLRALETMHLASASFAQRLEQVEGCQTELVGVLKNTNEELEATRASSVENVTIVNDNITALDRRLAGVGLRS